MSAVQICVMCKHATTEHDRNGCWNGWTLAVAVRRLAGPFEGEGCTCKQTHQSPAAATASGTPNETGDTTT